MLTVGRIHRIVHESVRSRLHAFQPLRHRAVEPHGGAQSAAGDFQPAHQRGEQGTRPYALETAPAVVHGLAQAYRNRTVGQRLAFDLYGRPNLRVIEKLVGDAAHGRCGNVADAGGPLRRIRLHVRDQLGERGTAFEAALRQHFGVGADLHRVAAKAAFQRRIAAGRVVRYRRIALHIP